MFVRHVQKEKKEEEIFGINMMYMFNQVTSPNKRQKSTGT